MKPLIIFLALILVFTAGFTYMGDMAIYRFASLDMKAAAEECAIEAAMALDEEAFGEGRTVFDRGAAAEAADAVLRDFAKRQRSINIQSYGYAVLGNDDSGQWAVYSAGFPAGEARDAAAGASPCESSVKAVFYARTEDFFALPFLEVTELCRAGSYAYENIIPK